MVVAPKWITGKGYAGDGEGGAGVGAEA